MVMQLGSPDPEPRPAQGAYMARFWRCENGKIIERNGGFSWIFQKQHWHAVKKCGYSDSSQFPAACVDDLLNLS
jgi:hypothetical protein